MSSTLLNSAKQGNPEAIATLLNHKLQPKGITVQASRHDATLHIVLTGQTLPPQASAVPYLKRAFAKLGATSIQTLTIMGQKYGTDRDMWTDTIPIVPQSTSAQHKAKVAADSVSSSNPSISKTPSTEESSTFIPNLSEAPAAASSQDRPVPSEATPNAFTPEPPQKSRSAKVLFPYWLKWQSANIKGGILLLFVILIVAICTVFFLARPDTGLNVDAAMGLSIVLACVVGLGLGGLFVGDSQAFCMKQYIPNANAWRWATCAGFTLGGMLTTVLQTIGYGIVTVFIVTIPSVGISIGFLSIILGGAMYGAIVASFQWLVLRPRVPLAYPWIVWSSIAGGVSFLLAAGLGLVGAWGAYSWSEAAGYNFTTNIITGVVGAVVSGTVVSWLAYHGISGRKMARFLHELDHKR